VLLDQRPAVAGGCLDRERGFERAAGGIDVAAAELRLDLVEPGPAFELRVLVARGELARARPAGLGAAEVAGADVQRRARLPDLGLEVVVADLAERLEGAVVGRNAPAPAAALVPALLIPDTEAAALEAANRVLPGDVVLVKASRSVRAERVIDALVAATK